MSSIFHFIPAEKPAAPTSLVATQVKEDSVVLSWTTPNTTPAPNAPFKYVIEQQQEAGD